MWICYLYIVELVEKPTQISFCSVKLNVTDMSYSSWFKRNKNSLHLICLSPIIVLLLWVRLPLWARSTTLCDQVGQWLATGRWFSPGPSTNKTDRHHITEILLKVALNTIKPTQTIHLLLNTRDMWVSEWVIVVKRKVDILFSYINGEDKLHFNEMMMSTLYKANTNTLSCICLVLAHWNNSPWVDMSPH